MGWWLPFGLGLRAYLVSRRLDGVPWEEAVRRCRHLTEEGTALADTPQDVWRLPIVEEAVRSMHRHGNNSGGS